MDDSKDIKRQDPLSRFFDKRLIRTNPFGGNQSGDRVYRRAERIAAALYLITEHIAEAEPLRNSVRAAALSLIDKVLSLRDEMRSPHSRHVSECRACIRQSISLVRILAVSGFLSMQNAEIVSEALDELGVFLGASQNSSLSESFSFSREDFADVSWSRKDIKDISGLKDTLLKDKDDVSDVQKQQHPLSVRELGILQILGGKESLGIKDISSNLPGYSEKMIQRDLVTLIALGRVRKTGLKRWSRYSLAR